MKNEYGVKMDCNGYAPSIVGTGDECYLCLCTPPQLVRHEIFHGTAFREKSKRLGLWCTLCPECHRNLHTALKQTPNCVPDDRLLKHDAMFNALSHYEWTIRQFIQEFGKTYFTDERITEDVKQHSTTGEIR